MCGIVGYIGKRKTYPILIKGLMRPEYRGYDSAGVAIVSDNQQLNMYRTEGKVSDLENFITQKDISDTTGIAHTRWATHGEPCPANAHPHYSSSEKLALIRNGIIENYAALREKLQAKGCIFKSSTDTEVLVQLIEYMRVTSQVSLLAAIQLALGEVVGAYVTTVLDKEHPDEVIAVRKNSPLVVEIGENEFFLAPDATPVVEYADKVVYLEDGEIVVLGLGEELKVISLNNIEMISEIKGVELNLGQLEREGYPHFMLKEIFKQPDCIRNYMRGCIDVEADNVVLSAVIDHREKLLNAKRFIIVACETSWHTELIDEHLIENFYRIPVEVEYVSEFCYRDPVVDGQDVVIAVSQSGETVDTLAAVELAKSHGVFVCGICSAIGSSIPRATHTGSYIHVGLGIEVASTKTSTGQITVLAMLALTLAKAKGTIDKQHYLSIVQELNHILEEMKEVLELNDTLAELSKTFTYAHNFIYLGRGYSYPVALGGALKLKEISHIHTGGYSAVEMKHGSITLVDTEMSVVVIATQNGLYEGVVSNTQEVEARKGKVIAFVTRGDTIISKIADCSIELPEAIECLDPLITTVPLQPLAHHIAVCKGMDMDQPRNLTKSVTVE